MGGWRRPRLTIRRGPWHLERMARFTRFLASIAIVMATAACGDESRDTVGDVVREIGAAYCDRGVECELFTGSERNDCGYTFQVYACDEVDCSSDFDGNDDRIDGCIDALAVLDCDALADNELPPVCAGAVRAVSSSAAAALARAPAAGHR
jgi:hypothetical protein